MENQEEEYICSDCGATVSASAKNCQNCGAVLEEIFEKEDSDKEDELIEIPLTSDPAKLSAILSLLDEKKIEYSINENPMENIWGPTFNQVPRLLISADLEDEVNEIIEDVDEGEIEIMEEEVFKDSKLEEKVKTKNLEGNEGWLLVLSLILILGPLSYLPYYIYDFFEIRTYLSRDPFAYTVVVIDLLAGTYISFLSIRAGMKLYNLKPDAVTNAINFFNIFIIYQIIGFIMVGLSLQDVKLSSKTILIFDLLITETISSITLSVVAKLYLQNSDRVKKTFWMGTK